MNLGVVKTDCAFVMTLLIAIELWSTNNGRTCSNIGLTGASHLLDISGKLVKCACHTKNFACMFAFQVCEI